ncbi:hypothetical protein [Agrobacterium sp. P15N1-A]|uniref:hypothetical protein n=1 Tax=Agrobacterium sp. P15N1-A TaxID=3342820 RepID=UPI0037D63E77
MTRLWLQPVFVPVKFYSAIENVDGISTRESEFYPQGVDIPTIDRASQAEYEGSIPFTRSIFQASDTLPVPCLAAIVSVVARICNLA